MARCFAMDMEVQIEDGVSKEQMGTLRRIFEEQWAPDEDPFYVEEYGLAVFSAEHMLYGGEGEEEAHQRIVAAVKTEIPNCSVTTRWTYIDEPPFEAYTD